MKTVLMWRVFLSTKWDTHFEFTTPKGQIPPRDEKKEDMRGKKRKTDIYITNLSDLGEIFLIPSS